MSISSDGRLLSFAVVSLLCLAGSSFGSHSDDSLMWFQPNEHHVSIQPVRFPIWGERTAERFAEGRYNSAFASAQQAAKRALAEHGRNTTEYAKAMVDVAITLRAMGRQSRALNASAGAYASIRSSLRNGLVLAAP